MTSYRIEVQERRTIIRETWIEAESAAQAREVAKAQDWREWSDQSSDTEAAITLVEDTDSGEVVWESGDE